MTSSLPRFALEGAFVVLLAVTSAGCGRRAPADPTDAAVTAACEKLRVGDFAAARQALAGVQPGAVSDDDVMLLKAQLAYHAKDYSGAAEIFNDLARDAARSPELRAEALVGLGVVDLECNELDRARISLLRALLLNRRSAPVRYHLGCVYRELGYEAAALEQFDAYAMLEKSDAVHLQRVQRQFVPELKRAIAAKAAERPGVDARNCAAAKVALDKAEAAFGKGQYKVARQQYQAALKADPLSYAAALGLARSWEKSDTTVAGRRKTLECYQAACSLKPGAITTLVKTGTLAMADGNFAIAVEAYSRAIAADPRNIDAIDGIIRALRKSGSEGVKLASHWQAYRDALKPTGKAARK